MAILDILLGTVIGSSATLLSLYGAVWQRGADSEASPKFEDDHRLAIVARWLRENGILHVVHEWLNVHGQLPRKDEMEEGSLLNYEITNGTRCTECSDAYRWNGEEFVCENMDCPAGPAPGAESEQPQNVPKAQQNQGEHPKPQGGQSQQPQQPQGEQAQNHSHGSHGDAPGQGRGRQGR